MKLGRGGPAKNLMFTFFHGFGFVNRQEFVAAQQQKPYI